jgi:hypothetical protein
MTITDELFMKKSRFKDKTLLLKAGREYKLKIIRIINIPGDRNYFMGKDVNGLKHLIPATYYKDYGIRAGDTVKCRLDRINCLGRFFFEPEHPVYKPGKTYEFGLAGFREYPGYDTGFYTATVIDIFGRKWETLKFKSASPPPVNITSLLCHTAAFKKGKLFLRVDDPLVIKSP